MQEEDTSADWAETKAIRVVRKGKGESIPIMMTAFDGGSNGVMEEAGWRGRYVAFSLVDGMVHDSFTDPRKDKTGFVNGELKGFLVDIKRGWETHGDVGIPWDEIADGRTYHEAEILKF